MWAQSLGRLDPLEEEMACIPVVCLENPWTGEPGGLQFLELQRIGHD